MWFQWDWADGPTINGRGSLLWCAWLAWSRFRVIIPTWDRTMPTVIACVDETLRRFDGSPTYALTDICRSGLIVVDDIGQLPAGQDEAEALYCMVDAAYERRSLVLTVVANLHPSAFDTILPKGLATATVDRLLHHAHVIATQVRSQRLEDALTGRGVVSLLEQADDDIRGRSRTSEERDTGPL